MGGVVVAHEILVTAQRPNPFFPFFGFDLGNGHGLWTGNWPRACQFLVEPVLEISTFILHHLNLRTNQILDRLQL